MVMHFDEKTFDEAVRGEKPVLVDLDRKSVGRERV